MPCSYSIPKKKFELLEDIGSYSYLVIFLRVFDIETSNHQVKLSEMVNVQLVGYSSYQDSSLYLFRNFESVTCELISLAKHLYS